MEKYITVYCFAIVFFLIPVTIPFLTTINNQVIKFILTASRKNIPRKYSMMIGTDCIYCVNSLAKEHSCIVMTVMLVFTFCIQHNGRPTFKI